MKDTMNRLGIEIKDILYVIVVVIGFLLHFTAFSAVYVHRLEAMEKILNGPPSMDSRTTRLEQAFSDMHDVLTDIRDRLPRR